MRSGKKYDLTDIKVIDKYVDLCRAEMDHPGMFTAERYGILLYVLTAKELPREGHVLPPEKVRYVLPG